MVDPMVVCAIAFPEGESEVTEAGLTALPSKQIAVPRIAESPVSFECRTYSTMDLPFDRSIVMGELLHLHIRAEAIHDKLHVDAAALDLVGRPHGPTRSHRPRHPSPAPHNAHEPWWGKRG